MPRKKRVKGVRETISFKDLQVLDFICRFGVVNRTAVQWWAETGRSVTLDRDLSERELLAEERRFGDRCYSARQPERGWHRPDLYRFTLEGEEPQEHAVEVELTAKAPERLVGILEAWQAHKMRNPRGREMIQPSQETPHWILYPCAPKVVAHVKRAVRKTGADWCVSVQELWFDHSPFARPESEPSGGLGDGRQPPKGVGAKPLDGRAAAANVAARSGGG
jgi:hypothetical protein